MYINCSSIKINDFIIRSHTEEHLVPWTEINNNIYIQFSSNENSSLRFKKDTNTILIYEWDTYYLDKQYKNINNKFLKQTPIGTIMQVKNFIGYMKIGNIIFQVESRKLTTKNTHELVKYIEGKINSLSMQFSTDSIGNFVFNRKENDHGDYLMFIKIYNELNKGEFQKQLNHIIRNPHHTLVKRKESKPIYLGKELSPDSIRDMLSFKGEFIEGEIKNSNSIQINKGLKKFFPKEITTTFNEVTYNTNENKFVYYTLNIYYNLIEKYRIHFKVNNSNVSNVFLDSLIIYKKFLQKHLNSPIFKEVTFLNYLNRSSMTLNNALGYKYMYKLYNSLLDSPENQFNTNNLIDLLENKSIDKLYEYYCLFTFIDLLDSILFNYSRTIKLRLNKDNFVYRLSEANDDIKVTYTDNEKNKVTLDFQYTFNKKNEGSYSLELSPDLTLSIFRGDKLELYHFDSKFRLKNSFSAHQEDIAKMHIYKDAINNTIGSFVLYPGEDSNIYNDKHDGSFSGVGSIPLQINQNNTFFNKFIKDLLKNK